MSAIAELFRLLHIGSASLSIAQCEQDIARAREDLAKAIQARDAAVATSIIEGPQPQLIPRFLLKGEA